MLRKLALLLALSAPTLPAAAAAEGFVDGYYIPTSQIKGRVGGNEAKVTGDGFGAHVMFPVASVFLITGEYQRNSYDEATFAGLSDSIDVTTDQYRVGFGAQSTPDEFRGTVYGEYIKLKVKDGDDADGFGLHARVTYGPMDPLRLFAEIGYVRVEEDGETLDGPEFLFGAAWSFTKQFAGFVDYRISRYDGNGGSDSGSRFYDLRTGVRFNL